MRSPLEPAQVSPRAPAPVLALPVRYVSAMVILLHENWGEPERSSAGLDALQVTPRDGQWLPPARPAAGARPERIRREPGGQIRSRREASPRTHGQSRRLTATAVPAGGRCGGLPGRAWAPGLTTPTETSPSVT